MNFPEDHYIEVEGLRIRYWQQGETGPYLLMLHGIGASVEYWHANIAEFAKHYRVIAVDLPGFGKSDKPSVNYDLAFFSDFLAAFCEVLQLKEMHLLAHSLGGAIALKFTFDHFAKIKKLILVDAVGFSTQVIIFFRLMGRPIFSRILTSLPKYLFAKALRSNVYFSTAISDELIEVLYPLAHSPGTRRAIRYITKHNTDWMQILPKVLQPLWRQMPKLNTLPSLLIWGKQDHLLAAEPHINAAKKLVPNMQIELFDQCGHIPQIEYPEKFNQAVLTFLQDKTTSQ